MVLIDGRIFTAAPAGLRYFSSIIKGERIEAVEEKALPFRYQ